MGEPGRRWEAGVGVASVDGGCGTQSVVWIPARRTTRHLGNRQSQDRIRSLPDPIAGGQKLLGIAAGGREGARAEGRRAKRRGRGQMDVRAVLLSALSELGRPRNARRHAGRRGRNTNGGRRQATGGRVDGAGDGSERMRHSSRRRWWQGNSGTGAGTGTGAGVGTGTGTGTGNWINVTATSTSWPWRPVPPYATPGLSKEPSGRSRRLPIGAQLGPGGRLLGTAACAGVCSGLLKLPVAKMLPWPGPGTTAVASHQKHRPSAHPVAAQRTAVVEAKRKHACLAPAIHSTAPPGTTRSIAPAMCDETHRPTFP
jgi:hypothetical protein